MIEFLRLHLAFIDALRCRECLLLENLLLRQQLQVAVRNRHRLASAPETKLFWLLVPPPPPGLAPPIGPARDCPSPHQPRGRSRVIWPLGRGQMTEEGEGALALFPVPINSRDEVGCARLGKGGDLPAD
jgi:hypothetical protein